MLLTSLIYLLTRDRNTKGEPAIKRRLTARINDWEAGKYEALFEDTLRSVKVNQRWKQGNEETNHKARIFHCLVMRGKVRTAARYITQRESGGVLQPTQKDTKTYKVDGQLTEKTVLESLMLKHLKAREPSTKTLERYVNVPPKVRITIREDMVGTTSGKLSGGAGLGGLDATALQQLLSARGRASTHLSCEVVHFVECMANFNVPWAAICGFMNNRLIALDKMPGIRPICIGEIWRRLFCKVLLIPTVAEAT